MKITIGIAVGLGVVVLGIISLCGIYAVVKGCEVLNEHIRKGN